MESTTVARPKKPGAPFQPLTEHTNLNRYQVTLPGDLALCYDIAREDLLTNGEVTKYSRKGRGDAETFRFILSEWLATNGYTMELLGLTEEDVRKFVNGRLQDIPLSQAERLNTRNQRKKELNLDDK